MLARACSEAVRALGSGPGTRGLPRWAPARGVRRTGAWPRVRRRCPGTSAPGLRGVTLLLVAKSVNMNKSSCSCKL